MYISIPVIVFVCLCIRFTFVLKFFFLSNRAFLTTFYIFIVRVIIIIFVNSSLMTNLTKNLNIIVNNYN